jgi:hypothetical protein
MGLQRLKIGEINGKGERKAKFSKRANEGEIAVIKLKKVCDCGHNKAITYAKSKKTKCTKCKMEVKLGVIRRKG